MPKRQFEGRVEQRRPAEGGARQLSEAGAFPGYEDVVARVLHVTRKGAQRALENVQGLRAKILLERERQTSECSVNILIQGNPFRQYAVESSTMQNLVLDRDLRDFLFFGNE